MTATREPVRIPKPYIEKTAAIKAPLFRVLANSEVMIAESG
jgi:hypothetical protein